MRRVVIVSNIVFCLYSVRDVVLLLRKCMFVFLNAFMK
jgi:hypothetical protein